MKTRIPIFCMIILSLVVFIPQASACSCAADRTIEESFSEADNVIFSGTVTGIKELQRTFLVTFEIEQSWKGIPDDVTSINTMTFQRSSLCGYNFTANQSYLVEAYGKWDQTPEVGICGSTMVLASAQEQISFLNKQTYENLEYGFSIVSPSGWIVDDNLPQQSPWIEIVAILPDQDYWSKGIYVNLWKNYFTVTPQEHLERHNENALAWCSSRSVENDGFTCSNYLLSNVQPTLIDDKEAYLLEEIWTRTENDKSSEVLLYNFQVFDGNDIWTVLAESVKDELNESDNFLLKIIDSFALLQNTSQEMQETTVLSPLKQLKNGILPQEIKCKEDLILTIKISDGSPACVKSETKAKLIERGWASN